MNLTYGETHRRWWPRLTAETKDGLLRSQTPTSDSLIVCLQREVYRGFSIFTPLYTFGNEMLKTPIEDRCFYEVIMGNNSQKPYFDIDMEGSDLTENNGIDLIKTLKKCILHDTRIQDSNILVFSSHGKGKFSYHVVVNGWCLPDYTSNKVYCHKVIDRIPDRYPFKKYIDNLVYKSIQQFRTFGSTKRGKDRYKKIDTLDRVKPPQLDRFGFLKILLSSLVTNTNSCRILGYSEPVKKTWDTSSIQDLTIEEIKILENLNFIKDGTFDLLEVKGRLIPLKRNQASFCKLCLRDHENENPYLTFSTDSTKIYFHCRRKNKDRVVIWEAPITVPVLETITTPESPPEKIKTISLKKFLGKR